MILGTTMKIKIALIILSVLFNDAHAETIHLRCNGVLESIFIPSSSQEKIKIEKWKAGYSVAESLRNDERLTIKQATRIFRIRPGTYVDTNAFGSAWAPRDVDIYFSNCTEENGQLDCKRDRLMSSTNTIDFISISFIPPWSVFAKEVYVNYPSEDNKGSDLSVANAYSYSSFSSMECEEFNPIPSIWELSGN